MPRVRWCLAAVLACHGPDAATSADPAAKKILASAPVTIDPARRCGEAGIDPTELPPALTTGLEHLGDGIIKANERQRVGTVEVHYDPDMLVSPMSVGVRAPALDLRMDQAEGKGGPWGTWLPLQAGRPQHVHLGPYRVAARSAPDLQTVTYTVARRACPNAATIAPTEHMVHLWLSTEAILAHTLDVQGAMLSVALEGHPEAPRIDVTSIGYRHFFEPRPDERRSLRVGARLVTIDGVTPGPDTHFVDGRWLAEGGARLHARVRIDSVPPTRVPDPVPATTPCGEAAPARTSLPAALAGPLGPADETMVRVGERRRLGPLELVATEQTVPPLPGREPTTLRQIAVRRGDALVHGVPHTPHGARLDRLGRDILRIDPEPAGGPARVRRWTAPCIDRYDHPLPAAPIHVWLSTVGHTRVPIGGTGDQALSLQVYPDPTGPTFSASSERAHYGQTIHPGMVGGAYTLDGFLVEILDVVAGPNVRWQDNRWRTDAPVPAIHVQVRVTRT